MLAVPFCLALLYNEYAFVFGTGLLACEYIAKLALQVSKGQRYSSAAKTITRQGTFWIDLASVGAALGIYIAFRLIHPSRYAGNVADGASNLVAMLGTILKHIYSGTIFPRLDFGLLQSPYEQLIIAAALAAASLVILLYAARSINPSRPWRLVALVAFLFSVYVTLPIAVTVKQQNWCANRISCGYVDSRIAYYGVVVLICALAAWLLTARLERRSQLASRVAVCGIIAGLSAATYLANWQRAQSMRAIVAGWERAAELACYPEFIPSSDELLLRLIDPQKLITFHPDYPKAAYWRAYIRDRQQVLSCVPTAARLTLLTRLKQSIEVSAGETVSFATPKGLMFLASGWSRPEDKGVWSNDAHSRLIVPVASPTDSVLFEMYAYVNPRHPLQRGEASVNGIPAAQFVFSKYAGNQLKIRIPAAARHSIEALGYMSIDFNLPDAVRPADVSSSRDTRRLGDRTLTV